MCGYQQRFEGSFLNSSRQIASRALSNAPWIQIVSLIDPQSVLAYGLDPGEPAVLALAEEHDARLVIIDEKDARKEAQRIGLQVKGTIGVLLEAKQKGLIDEIRPLLERLWANGMHLGQSVIDDALQRAGETS